MNDGVTRGGLWLVGIVAAVWSFTALADLAWSCGITSTFTVPPVGPTIKIAWGLPLTVDVLAVVMTRAWLRGDLPAAAVIYAQRAAWGAITASIVGNAYHGLKVGNWAFDALVVSAAPAIVLGVIGHLAVLAGRAQTGPASAHTSTEPGEETVAEPLVPLLGDPVPAVPELSPGPPPTPPLVEDQEAPPPAERPSRQPAGRSNDVIDAELRALVDAGEPLPSITALRKSNPGMGPDRARTRLAVAEQYAASRHAPLRLARP